MTQAVGAAVLQEVEVHLYFEWKLCSYLFSSVELRGLLLCTCMGLEIQYQYGLLLRKEGTLHDFV